MGNEHYFTSQPTSQPAAQKIKAKLRGREYQLITEACVFSRSRVIGATRLLVEALPLPSQGKLLDLGCGYGPVKSRQPRKSPHQKL